MVLKSLLLSFILLFSFEAQAESAYQKASRAYKGKRYRAAVKILAQNYNISKITSATPPNVYELLGRSLVKLRKYKLGVKFLRAAVTTKYFKVDRKARAKYFRQGDADGLDELPDGLYRLYYYTLEAAVKYTRQLVDNGRGPGKNIDTYIEVFSEILLEAEYKEDEVEKLTTEFGQMELEVERREYYLRWYTFVGYISWQDQVKFVDSTGSEFEITAPAEGSEIGFGWKKDNYYWGYKMEFSYGALTSNAGFNTANVNYFQKGVSVSLLQAQMGAFWKPFTREVAIGINIPLFYKTGSYEAPPGSTIEGASKLSTGFVIEGQWYLGDWYLNSRIGKILGLSSGYWGVALGYHF